MRNSSRRRPSPFALLLAAAAAATASEGRPAGAAGPRDLALAPGASVKTLPQNWTDEEARWFYGVPQGSKLIPYAWFLHLEQADSQTPFRDAEHVRSLGYLARNPGDNNPDGLPIGFTKDGAHLGLTCAACHTNQIDHAGQGWLIDGAPTLGDFATFLRRLEQALAKTAADPQKLDRFAAKVLRPGATAAVKAALKSDLEKTAAFRRGYNERNLPAPAAPPFGPGRVDAFGAILNEVTVTFARVPENVRPANAPVSLPFLWDTPQHDRVQWNGAAENQVVGPLALVLGTAHVGALGRNSGEVLGVFGRVDADEEGLLLNRRGYPSTVNRTNLITIEEAIRELQSPLWPDGLPPIDATLRDAGSALFAKHCASCHAPIRRDDPGRRVQAAMSDVGTDQTMAANFATRTAANGVAEGRRVELQRLRRLPAEGPGADLLVHMVQRTVARRPRRAELAAAFDGERTPASPAAAEAPLFAAAEAHDLSHEDLLAGIDALADWSPQYTVFADVRVGDRRLAGGFSSLDLSDGRVRQAVSAEAPRLLEAARSFRLEVGPDAEGLRFVGPDDEELSLSDLRGVAHAFSAAGTRLTFEEPAEISYAYKGRPLNGIWATAPYLHNGSVPNLDELLKPAAARVKKFKLGSREFDPAKVGFTDAGDFEFDASLPSNSNSGHEYGDTVFTDDERKRLVEYMKSL